MQVLQLNRTLPDLICLHNDRSSEQIFHTCSCACVGSVSPDKPATMDTFAADRYDGRATLAGAILLHRFTNNGVESSSHRASK
jgi:hypothetical protein